MFEKVYWKDVREQLLPINPELTKIIDQISPSPKYFFYRAKYSYGQKILKKGRVYLPCGSNLVSLDSTELDNDVREQLNYNNYTCPVVLALTRPFEFFIELQTRDIPFFIMQAGDLFGTWNILSPDNNELSIWEMTAGARSTFLLPKISESLGHHNLRKTFGFDLHTPKSLRDHWAIFRALYNSTDFDENWDAELLFFNRAWFENFSDPVWRDLKLYFYKFNWACSKYWWDTTLSRINNEKETIKAQHYIDISRHLLSLSQGALPGFVAAENDFLGPMKKIQDIYKNIYGLKKWSPIIMQPYFFNFQQSDRAVYYSFAYHSAVDLALKANTRKPVLDDIYTVKTILDKRIKAILSSSAARGTRQFEASMNTTFHYYHPLGDKLRLEYDEDFFKKDLIIEKALGFENWNKFPFPSQFFNGCVKIEKK